MKVLIIEDEFPVRSALKKMLQLIAPDIEVIAEAETVKESISLLNSLSPDLVFMDIELKDGISFEILKSLTKINFQIIFITAFNHYAIKAFKFSAVDYLLKPIDPQELREAIAKAKSQIEREVAYQNSIIALQQNIEQPEQLVIKTTENRYIIPLENIFRFEADGAYTYVHYTDGHILCSKNLKHYENLLPKETFYRCHQSHLVHLKQVVQYSKDSILLTNNHSIPISHRRKTELKKRLKNYLS